MELISIEGATPEIMDINQLSGSYKQGDGMADRNLGFAITGVKWRMQTSREKGVQQPQEVRGGVLSALVVCKTCGETWLTTEGTRPGQFRSGMGGIMLSCPKCKADASIDTNTL